MADPALTAAARICIDRSAGEVYAAFVDPALMCRFWFPRSTGPLVVGAPVQWFTGTDEAAIAIDVRVLELIPGALIRMDWGHRGAFTHLVWTFSAAPRGGTLLEVIESGFTGSAQEIIDRALDSTGGFNQVVVAAKALLEHGVAVNVVEAHG